LAFQRLTSLGELEQQLKSARGRKVLLYFGADWCTSCKALERTSFRDPRVQERLKDLIILKADLTDMTEAAQALMKKFGLFGPPAILFFDEQGQEIKTARLIGEQELLERLNKLLG
jgi:thiol:disulfide interchange protein DsbD